MMSPLRGSLVTLLIVALLVLVALSLNTLLLLDRSMEVYDLNKSETARIASNLYFAKMTAIAQVSVALIASAWALITLSDIRVRVEGYASTTCFVIANIALGLSLLVYSYGYDFMVVRIFHHASFDPDAEYISGVKANQQWLFLHGLASLACSVFFSRRVP